MIGVCKQNTKKSNIPTNITLRDWKNSRSFWKVQWTVSTTLWFSWRLVKIMLYITPKVLKPIFYPTCVSTSFIWQLVLALPKTRCHFWMEKTNVERGFSFLSSLWSCQHLLTPIMHHSLWDVALFKLIFTIYVLDYWCVRRITSSFKLKQSGFYSLDVGQ